MPKKKLKVGFAMGGGVSLGSFSGGAMAEVIHQLQNNLNTDVYHSFEVDAVSGASAGGMTVGILIRALADPGNTTGKVAADRVLQLMRQAWVDDPNIDISNLISDVEMDDKASFLDREAVDRIAARVIGWPEDKAPSPKLLAERVLLGVTLLNYNGIPISQTEIPALGDSLSTTLFQDYRMFCLDFKKDAEEPPSRWISYDLNDLKNPGPWKTIAATTIGGGAFPLAFEPVVLTRREEEFGKLWPRKDLPTGTTEFKFTHGDGGAFNNEPLREAAKMIRHLDSTEAPGTFDRILVVIDPSISGPNHDFSLPFHMTHEIDRGLGFFDGEDVVPADFSGQIMKIGERLLTAIRGQASFKDFLAADKINNRLAWRNQARVLVQDVVSAIPDARARDLDAKAAQALKGILKEKENASAVPDTALKLKEERERIRLELQSSANSADIKERLSCTLLALLDQVAGLRGKSAMHIYGIAPTQLVRPQKTPPQVVKVELAGDFLHGFGGFFDREFREYDFQVGRAMAGSVLASPPASGPHPRLDILKDKNNREDRPKPLNPDLGSRPGARKRFQKRLGFVAGAMAKSMVPYPVLNLGAAWLAEKLIPSFIKNPDRPRELAIIRFLIVPDNAQKDEFFLTPSKGGDQGERVRARGRTPVELRTVVRFSLAAGGPPLDGPHVFQAGNQFHVKLTENRTLRQDHEMKIKLPTLKKLRQHMAHGLPIHTLEVDWRKREPGTWVVTDGLDPLELTL